MDLIVRYRESLNIRNLAANGNGGIIVIVINELKRAMRCLWGMVNSETHFTLRSMSALAGSFPRESPRNRREVDWEDAYEAGVLRGYSFGFF